MRHGIKLGKRGDGLTQVMKLLGQVFKNSRLRNIVLLFHHNLSHYPFGFSLRQYHSLQLGGRRGPSLIPGPKACRAQGRGFPWSKQASPAETKALVGSGKGGGLCLSHSYKLIVYRGTIK
jgi:hypothetical protein